jgi:hypothetical protein
MCSPQASFGVRGLDRAFHAPPYHGIQSGVEPPHSKAAPMKVPQKNW